MPAIIKNKFTKEDHPWNWYIPLNATKLFIGTFPSESINRKYDFFYSSSTNRFWEVATQIAQPLNEINIETDEIKKRKLILDKLKLGLTDMGKKVYRQQGSSKDHSLFPLEFMDIVQILQQNLSIHTLIVSGNMQGNSSLKWLSVFCDLNNIPINIRQIEKHKSAKITVAGRNVNVLLTYSPSRLSRIKDEKLQESYQSILLI